MDADREPGRVGAGWVAGGLALAGAFTLATWAFEGRLHTLLRPGAVGDRLVYLVVANLAVGLLAGLVFVRGLLRTAGLPRQRLGFGPPARAAAAGLFGGMLGVSAYLASRPVPAPTMAVINAYGQVLAVSVAEVVVCWVALGGAVREWLRPRLGPVGSGLVAIGVSAGGFGLYHFGHSPPFDTWAMVGRLSLVGLATGVVFFGMRSLYAAVLFHNFLGARGVVEALAGAGRLDAYAHPLPAALGAGAVMLVALVAADALIVRARLPAQR